MWLVGAPFGTETLGVLCSEAFPLLGVSSLSASLVDGWPGCSAGQDTSLGRVWGLLLGPEMAAAPKDR